MRFGLNDSLANHNWKRWQPVSCAPDIFRTVCWWNDVTYPWSAATDMGLWGDPSKAGIVCLFGPQGGLAPSTQQYQDSVSTILGETPDNLLVEVWNEPNDPRFGWVTSAQCRDLIAAAIKADNGRGRVLGPAVNPGFPGAASYMLDAYANRPACPTSVHIYPRSNPWTSDFDYWLGLAHQCNGYDFNKTINITEMALLQNVYGPSAYGYAAAAFNRAASWPNVRSAVYHRLKVTEQFDFAGSCYFYAADGSENAPLVSAMAAVH